MILYGDGTIRQEWNCTRCSTELVWADDETGYGCPRCLLWDTRPRRPLPADKTPTPPPAIDPPSPPSKPSFKLPRLR